MDNLGGLLGIGRIDGVPNVRIVELCGVGRGIDEWIDGGVLRWFGHVEGMEGDGIAERVYVGERAGGRSVGGSWKRWIDTMKECLRKGGLDVGQAG